jgi:hypothetical protein
MSYGPIELIVVKFPGNQFKGEIVPSVQKLLDAGIVHIIDILFIKKDQDGKVDVFELNDVDDDTNEAFGPLITGLAGILGEEDARSWAAAMEANSSVVLLLFENLWAAPFVEAVRNANGQVVLNERIPRSVIEKLVSDMATA